MAEKTANKRKRTKKTTFPETPKQILKTTSGHEYEVTAINGKFFVCGNRLFSANSPFIACVVAAPTNENSKEDAADGEC